MKKIYKKPEAEKLEFEYTDNVAASNTQGHKYRLYTDGYWGCREIATDIWVDDPTNP